MAYTIENNYTGNGSTRIYSFTFPYLEDTDIKVSLNQVDTTNFELANATQINFTADASGATSTQEASGAPKSSVAIRVYRDTNIDNLQSEFFSGSAVRAQDLNNDFNQTLYVCQETEKSVDGKWNDSTQTLDSTEAFIDSDSYIMTAKAIDDRINTNIASHSLTDGKIWAGNGSNVSAQVTPSGDVTMSNAGAFTIANGAVEHAMLANDSVDGDNIQDDAINSEHITDGSVDLAHLSANSVNSSKIVDGSIVNADLNSSADIAHSKLASVTSGQILVGNGSNVPTAVAVSGDVTLANDGAVTIANDAVEQAMIADDAVGADQLASNAVVNASVASGAAIAHNKLANVTDGQILVGNGSNVPTAVAVSGDVTIANTGAVTIANNAVEIGMIGCEQTTISDSDSHIPTSGAVVDYVSSVIAPIGGLEVIADDESFPNTIPAAGVVISITDAAGLQVNSSGVSTNGDTLDNSTVTINGFPSELRGGVGSNPDPYVFQSGAGLMVVSTGSSQTYNYHQAMIRESDFVQLSDDINDFNNRYRVAAGEPGSDNDEGDLVFDTNANKMKVYDGSSWGEVTSTGDFKYLVLTNPGTTDAPTLTNATFDLKETSTSGSAASVASAAQLIVSVNGVIQKANTGTSAPAEGFALSDADTIVFSSAPGAGASIFIIQIGSAVSIPTPGDGTVSAAKIAAGAVIAAKIGTGAVEHAKLAADCVDGDNLADNAVDSEHYTDGSIDNEHLADNAVNLDEMAHGTQGDVLYYGSGGAPARLGAGTNGYFLKTQGGSANPVWAEVTTTDTLSNRNVIINSAFEIAQRVTSSTSQEYVLDRWYQQLSGASSTLSQETFSGGDEIEGSGKYARMNVTTGADWSSLRYRVENVRRLVPGSWTLSFWAKGTTPPGGLKFWANQDFGSSGSADVDIAETSLTALDSTWTRQSLTFTVPSLSGKTINDADSFFNFHIGQGSSAASTAWDLLIANVQLEEGTSATTYEKKSISQEMQDCQRYCQVFHKKIGLIMRVHSSTQVLSHIPLKSPMRAVPTYTIAPSSANYDLLYGGSVLANQASGWAFSAGGARLGGFELMNTRSSGTYSSLDTVLHANLQHGYGPTDREWFAKAEAEL
tara:strand:- start:128 stop:3463 length:3336 start_codon:yes stop_codon:yes gene_type:complete